MECKHACGNRDTDAARSALEQASAALTSAVTGITVSSERTVFTIGENLDPALLSVVATRADGSSAELTAGEFTVTGFSSATAGDPVVTMTAAPAVTATDAAPVQATLAVAVRPAWDASTAYPAGAEAASEGSVWLASWWTSAQKPGDPNGPWQQIVQADGVAVWTPSRVFVAGDLVTHDGARYTAKWWTRNQLPGDPNGPWKPVAG